MPLLTEPYADACRAWPPAGPHILAHQTDIELVVYQAYRPAIAQFAVAHQRLGGPEFSYGRMSWIKPNFLWMMFRCGWATKENQERVLALWLPKAAFEEILGQAVFSTFGAGRHATPEAWQQALRANDVRLQWDPDHGPRGHKLERRALQLGLKGAALAQFGQQQLTRVEDITEFVHEQRVHVEANRLDELRVPLERVYRPAAPGLAARVGIEV